MELRLEPTRQLASPAVLRPECHGACGSHGPLWLLPASALSLAHGRWSAGSHTGGRARLSRTFSG